MRISCYLCGGCGRICKAHPDNPTGHAGCEAPGIPCPRCNRLQSEASTSASTAIAPFRRSARPRETHSGRFAIRSPGDRTVVTDSFDYGTLWQLLAHVAERHPIVRFIDLARGRPDGPFCILRHDVDYTLDSATRLAREEAARGIHATYFLLVNSAYYNLLSPSHANVPRELVDLGHEVGLHYDVNFLQCFDRDRWEELLDAQARLLEGLSGRQVVSIAMHQPGLNGEDPFRTSTHYLNAYSDEFARDIPYFSDSCRAWHDVAWQSLTVGPLPKRLQLALHPINWADRDRARETIFRDLHVSLSNALLAEGEDLLAKIAVHAGVLEHKARTARIECP